MKSTGPISGWIIRVALGRHALTDTGHFALEEDGDLSADKIRDILGRHVP